MKGFEFDPLSLYGLKPKDDMPVAMVQNTYNRSLFYTKAEVDAKVAAGGGGDTLWQTTTSGPLTFLEPVTNTNGLLLGSDVDASIFNTFSGTSAVFNGDISGSFGGINYFLTLAYGTSFLGLGGLYTSGHAPGTPSSPTQTLNGNYLGGHIFTGYDGAGSWVVNAAAHALTGLWSQATADVGTYLEQKIFIGGAATPMISFESSSNAIKLNEAQLAATTTIYNDLGASLTLDGSTGAALFTNSTATSIPVTVKGYTAQSANLQEWQASGGSVLSYVDSSGNIGVDHTGKAVLRLRSTNSDQSELIFGSGTSNMLFFDPVGGGIRVYVNASERARFNTTGTFQVNSPTNTVGTVEKFRVNSPTTVDNLANVIFSASATTTKPLVIQGKASQTANLQEWQASAGTPLAYIDSAGLGGFAGLNITDAKNIVLGSTTGTKIGTATTQKIGLWNATPIVQPTTAIAASTFAANTSGIVDDSATWDGYTIGQVVKALRNIGALA